MMIDDDTAFQRATCGDTFVFKGYLDITIHSAVITSFQVHPYNYRAIQQDISNKHNYLLPLHVLEDHITKYITYLHIAGYELPLQAVPVPFDLSSGDHVTEMRSLINSLNEGIKNKKKNKVKKSESPLPFFYISNSKTSPNSLKNSMLYQNYDTLSDIHLTDILDKISNCNSNNLISAVKHIYTVGIMSLKQFCEEYLVFTKNFRADRDDVLLMGHKKKQYDYLKHVLHVYKPSTQKYVVIKRNSDQELFNKHIHQISRLRTATQSEPSADLSTMQLNSHNLVLGIKKLLTEGRWKDTFVMCRLETLVHNMNQTSKLRFRFPDAVKLYAHSQRNYLGDTKYQRLIGQVEMKDHTTNYDPRKINDILPSLSLLDEEKGPLIEDMGVYSNYIQLCSELLKNAKLDNLWSIMVDSVDIQVNLTVCRSKGLIYGVSGKIYKISDVLREEIFGKLKALEHLARKATVVIVCHASNSFHILAACSTCSSEKNSDVAKLLRGTLTVCKESNVNVQQINSDGASLEAVKSVTVEFGISGASCVCHWNKICRNNLLADAKYHRPILIPVEKVHLITEQSQYNSKIVYRGLNFITVEISNVDTEFDLQILKGNGRDVLFEARISKDGCLPYFDDNMESGYRVELDATSFSLNFSIYKKRHSFDNLIFKCSTTSAQISCCGYIVQRVTMDTIRKTYEDDPDVQKLISWEGMHCTDKMKESYMAEICSDEYLDILSKKFPQYPGLYQYLRMMNLAYQPSAADKPLAHVELAMKDALDIVEEMRDLTKYLDGSYGLSQQGYTALKMNVSGISRLIQYLATAQKPMHFSTRLYLTNRLEGLFGRARDIMRRFTHYQFMFILTKLVNEMLQFLHPDRKHNMQLGKKTHYIHIVEDKKIKGIEAKALFDKYRSKSGRSSYPYSEEEGKKAQELAVAFYLPRVKNLRASYYGAKYNDLGKLYLARHTPSVFEEDAIQSVTTGGTTTVQAMASTDFQLKAKVKELFVRPASPLQIGSNVATVFMDMEWNQQGQIISLGACHNMTQLEFYSLAKQQNAGRTQVHNITTDILRSAPSLLNVLQEFIQYLKCFNTRKVLLIAHWGLGADFPKLMKAINTSGIKISFDLEFADSRYAFQYQYKQQKIQLKLPNLYKQIDAGGSYNKHNALADAQVLARCSRELLKSISDHKSDQCMYNHYVWCQPASAKQSFYEMIESTSAVAPSDYMYVKDDLENKGICVLTTHKRKSVSARKSSRSTQKKEKKQTRLPVQKKRKVFHEEYSASDSEDEIMVQDNSHGFQRKSGRSKEVVNYYQLAGHSDEDDDPMEVDSDSTNTEASDSDNDNDKCMICEKYGDLMICDTCDNSCHVQCAYPAIDEIPDGDWYCRECLTELGLLEDVSGEDDSYTY